MLVMIDNYDSFTYNLVQYFCELGQDVKVFRNDQITVADIESLQPDHLVISPGPCTPNEAGISLQAVDVLQTQVPILGVCLGHQSLAQVMGACVIRAKNVMHGKTSWVYHNGSSVFEGLPSPYEATRYHSLVVQKDSLPDCFELTAWTQDADGEMDEIMGIQHQTLPLVGVQFHPESILTQHGHALLQNFLTLKA